MCSQNHAITSLLGVCKMSWGFILSQIIFLSKSLHRSSVSLYGCQKHELITSLAHSLSETGNTACLIISTSVGRYHRLCATVLPRYSVVPWRYFCYHLNR